MSYPVQVDVQIASGLSNVPAISDIQNWLEQVVDHVGTGTARSVEISVRIVDEAEGLLLAGCQESG